MMNIDNAALIHTMAALANPLTGFGTGRDKTQYTQIKAQPTLSREQLNALYRSSAPIRRIIDEFPVGAAAAWMSIHIGAGETADVVEEYIRSIGSQPDRQEGEPSLDVVTAFTAAAQLARLHGNAAVLMGIADGLDPSEPVAMGAIASVRWLLVVPRHSITRQGDAFHIFDATTRMAQVWHGDRVLWFRGAPILDPSDSLAVQGFDDSVIQSVYAAYAAYWGAVAAAGIMVQDFDQAIFSVQGLAELVNGSAEDRVKVMQRFTALDMGRSVARAAVLDRTLEDFEYVSRDFAGVKDIIDTLRNEWISASGLPSWKLFGTSTGAGLATANTAGLAARFEWAALVESWMAGNFVPHFRRLVRYCFAARDCGQGEPEMWDIAPNSAITLTPLEMMEIQKVAAKRDQINIAAGIYDKTEARRQYAAPEFTGAIVVEEEPPIDGDRVREDWKAGLLDDLTALQMLGYPNPEAIAARLVEKRGEQYAAY